MKRLRVNKNKEGDLRVWNIINPPSNPTDYPVETIKAGKKLIDALADSQLLNPNIICNVFGLEVLKDGEWEEWEDDYGNNITDEEVRIW